MSTDHGSGRLAAGFLFVVAMIIVGATAGGVIASVTETSDMGWDQIANALGGVMIGAVAGLVIAVWGTRRLSGALFGKAVALAVLVAAGLVTLGGVRIRREMARAAAAASPVPTTPAATAPTALPPP